MPVHTLLQRQASFFYYFFQHGDPYCTAPDNYSDSIGRIDTILGKGESVFGIDTQHCLIIIIIQVDPSDGDYLAVGMNDGSIEFRFNLGNGEGIATSLEPVLLNETHVITIIRYNRRNYVCL